MKWVLIYHLRIALNPMEEGKLFEQVGCAKLLIQIDRWSFVEGLEVDSRD
jgi:hypothetical protein